MSVLECNRNGCRSIMCDYYSHKFGYLCGSCKSELERIVRTQDGVNVESFMASRKPEDDYIVYTQHGIDEIFKER